MNNSSKEMFGRRLVKLREGKNLSQKQCAIDLGMEDASKYNKWENGKNAPDFETVCHLARFFEVTTDYLLGNSDAKKPENQEISERLGLSETAINLLENKYSIARENSLTLTINTLLEDQYVLRLLSQYLYYELDKDTSDSQRVYSAEYKYQSNGSVSYIRSPDDIKYGEPSAYIDFLDDEKFKKIVMLEIMEALAELLEKEKDIKHFEY